jgi:hypothetical protein
VTLDINVKFNSKPTFINIVYAYSQPFWRNFDFLSKILFFFYQTINKIVIFILSARRECFLCMKRSFTPRRRSRQYKPLNAQKHLRARNINNIFSIIDSKN